jgi:hypothetical protein
MTISQLIHNGISGTVITSKGITQTRHLLKMGIKVCTFCHKLNKFENMMCVHCREELVVIVHDLKPPINEKKAVQYLGKIFIQ